MVSIIMYCTTRCTYCARAEELLKSKGINHIEKIYVDYDINKKDEMIKKTNKKTVPQIFINGAYIGGFDDLSALDKSGELNSLLCTD